MNESMIVSSAKSRERKEPAVPESRLSAWRVLGWIGLVFLIVGGMDFVLVWTPTNFANREWQFGSVTQSFNGLPILLLGVGLLTVAGEQAERTWWQWVGTVAAAALLLAVVGGFLLWASNVSLAMATVPENLARGVQEAIAKTAVQSVAYTAILGYLLGRVWIAHKEEQSKKERAK